MARYAVARHRRGVAHRVRHRPHRSLVHRAAHLANGAMDEGSAGGPRAPPPRTSQGGFPRPVFPGGRQSGAEPGRGAARPPEKKRACAKRANRMWTPERLRASIQNKSLQRSLFVVSNREPYMDVHRGKGIETIVPASGLVTALEPILRACDGEWIAHGSGEADRETVDENDRLRVPPDKPEYTLRRVWLTKEEEEGYYYGFSNEGLWPLCHIAHTRPLFRTSDWQSYQDANRKFADAVIWKRWPGPTNPWCWSRTTISLCCPRMVKEARPDARIAIFWHIPWPNPEAFGICPWQRELLDGLLGADLVGFHIQAHCNNFLETVDRALESRIEWERFAVKRHGHTTLVRPFPISVDFRGTRRPRGEARLALRRAFCPAEEPGHRGELSRHRRGSHRLHQGNPRAVPRDRAVSGKVAGATSASLRSSRSAHRAARISSATTTSTPRWKRKRRASMRAFKPRSGSRSPC